MSVALNRRRDNLLNNYIEFDGAHFFVVLLEENRPIFPVIAEPYGVLCVEMRMKVQLTKKNIADH